MGQVKLIGGDFSNMPYLLYARAEDFNAVAVGKVVYWYDRTVAPNHEVFFIEGGVRHVLTVEG